MNEEKLSVLLTNGMCVFEALFLQIGLFYLVVQKFHTLPLKSNKSNKDCQKMNIYK